MYSKEVMEFVIASLEKYRGDEVPVFAAIAIDNKVVSSSFNKVEVFNTAWFHAEFLAIQKAVDILETRYLETSSLYVTLEPCAFCAAALEKVRIKNIFFGAYDPKCGALVHNSKIFEHSTIKPQIIGGIQEERCSKVLTEFFEYLRNRNNDE